ncbi:MAG TPA: hypothetical protein VFG37_13705 [Planctomycetota bacterium]|jgi:Tol biopolymer transport system component|nr:hypothetical protein [Planctomycetota bacterium]
MNVRNPRPIARAAVAALAALVLGACSGGAILDVLLRGGSGGHGARSSGGVPPPGGVPTEVIVASDLLVDGKSQLFDCALDGTAQSDLSGSIVAGGNVKRLKISPDRTRVAFIAAKERADADELYVVDLTTSAAPVKLHPGLPAGRHVRDLRWSPDATRVAFVVDLDQCGEWRLHVTNADGSGHVRVLPDSAGTVLFPLADEFDGTVAAFEWSADSRHLAAATDDPGSDAADLYVVAPDGSGLRKIAPYDDGAGLPFWRRFQRPYVPFAWSTDPARPDHLAYLVDEVACACGTRGTVLRSVAADGSDDRRLSHSFEEGNDDPDDLRLAWSPDGRRIVYATDGQVQDRVELWSTDPRTADHDRDSFRVSKNCQGAANDVLYAERDSFEWSADSRTVAFRGDLDVAGRIELYAADPFVVDPMNYRVNAELACDGQNVEAFRWSPDSAHLAYIADEVKLDRFELFTATPIGASHAVVSRIEPGSYGDVLFRRDSDDPAYDAFEPPIQWSPDGRRLAYLADEVHDGVFEAFAAMTDGSNHFRICADLKPVCGDACRVTWVSDSLLLYAADEREQGRFELMTAFPDGPTGTIVTGADRRGGTFCPLYELP